jgi:hypothetical protein
MGIVIFVDFGKLYIISNFDIRLSPSSSSPSGHPEN